ncbi:MAG: hypothetical protein KIS89_02040 [Dokdonella sp.]|nr:hypothetical protein [Dokdonella sp.]
MSEDAVNLTRALKGDSGGAWGLALERAPGHQAPAGRARIRRAGELCEIARRAPAPAIIVHLPEDKDIIDKMSLVAYEAFRRRRRR